LCSSIRLSDLVPALKARPSDQIRKRLFGRNVLVTVQVAGALVLLISATQLFRGFGYLLSHSRGFPQAMTWSKNFSLRGLPSRSQI
jgi:hypothetical protein